MILSTAFAFRQEHWIVPDRGLGYALGIAGLASMTALLGYSVRKRAGFARRWGRVPTWFRVHMFLGIAGPCAVLLHCNFSLGSVNANVALACVLAVSASGVVGRLLYGRIHAGLFGRRLSLLELKEALAEDRRSLAGTAGRGGLSAEALDRFERDAAQPRGALGGALRALALARRRRQLLRAARGPEGGGAARAEALERYLRAAEGVARFSVYERLFALWHGVHLPFCVVLFAAAVIHVVAVHVY